jgi:uncharacterized protein (DUF1499 family)
MILVTKTRTAPAAALPLLLLLLSIVLCEGLVNNNRQQPPPVTTTATRSYDHRHLLYAGHDLDDYGVDSSSSSSSHPPLLSRRLLLSSTIWASMTAIIIPTTTAAPSWAFDNKSSTRYDDRPKRRGPQPADLGVRMRTRSVDEYYQDDYQGLKGCGVAPNCFSSSVSVNDDPDHSIPPWTSPSANVEQSMAALKAAVEAYPPGQNGVDGGGFQIQSYDPKKGYLYVQFEALKNGYIDDVEFAVVDSLPLVEGADQKLTVQVRSSSRIGYLDYGVNAKRLNYLAATLRGKGWDSPGVDFKTHAFYAAENQPPPQ